VLSLGRADWSCWGRSDHACTEPIMNQTYQSVEESIKCVTSKILLKLNLEITEEP
jgi:hypothetical protein